MSATMRSEILRELPDKLLEDHRSAAERLYWLNTNVSDLYQQVESWPGSQSLLGRIKNLHRTIRDLRVLMSERAVTELGNREAQGLYFRPRPDDGRDIEEMKLRKGE